MQLPIVRSVFPFVKPTLIKKQMSGTIRANGGHVWLKVSLFHLVIDNSEKKKIVLLHLHLHLPVVIDQWEAEPRWSRANMAAVGLGAQTREVQVQESNIWPSTIQPIDMFCVVVVEVYWWKMLDNFVIDNY